MTKRDFLSFIKQDLNNLSLEDQEKLIEKIQYDWMPEMQKKFYEKVKKKHIKCPKCEKYVLKKASNFRTKQSTFNQCVFHDAGYGDDDQYADVTYSITYIECPYCNNHIEIDRMYLHESNRTGRW